MGPNWPQAEGFILGVGAKMFTIAGPVIACSLLLWYNPVKELSVGGGQIMIQEIIRIQYAESTLPESWIFDGGEKEKRIQTY